MRRILLILLFLCLIVLNTTSDGVFQAQSAFSGDLETIDTSIMRPGMDIIREWMNRAKAAPKAYIAPHITSVMAGKRLSSAATEVNLLSHLQYSPSERNQGSCGNCWNWAAQGVLGIALDVNTETRDRLSVQFVNSCKEDRFACCGGWLEDFVNWYSAQKIAIPWSNTNAAYADASTRCQDGSSDVSCGMLDISTNHPIESIESVIIDTTGTQSQSISNIKNVLAQNKAIWFGFFLPNQDDWNQFFDFWSNKGESDLWSFNFSQGHQWTSDGGGHAVLLVGYNENAPEPYWILLNSWGTTSGRPNGLFRMKMDMNYSLFHLDGSKEEQGLYFQTMDVQFVCNTPGECTYSIFPTAETFSASGGSGSFAVTVSSSSCAWTVSKTADWITNVSPSSGTGNATVTYQISANTSDEDRQGTLMIQGQTLTVEQGCALTRSNLLQNPGFENGWQNVSWVEASPYEIINWAPCYTFGAAECAHGGEWVAWLGGYNNAYDAIQQSVTIPPSAVSASLQFWYVIDTWDYVDAPYDVMSVWVYNGQWHNVFQLSNMNWSYDWTQTREINLSGFVGQTITIAFVALTDQSLFTNFYIDDVELLSHTPQTTSPSPSIRANGQNGPIDVLVPSKVSFTVRLQPDASGQNADWWFVQSTPEGTFYHLDLSSGSMVPGLETTHQGPLFTLGTTQVLNTSKLTVGPHTFYFGVDLNMNGALDFDELYYDAVKVNAWAINPSQ